jgi:hypothetical protein
LISGAVAYTSWSTRVLTQTFHRVDKRDLL